MKSRVFLRSRLLILADLFLIAVAALGSFALRTDLGPLFMFYLPQAFWLLAIALLVKPVVFYLFGLYRRLRLNRVYFSAYQRGLGDPSLPGERNRPANPGDLLTREHRLYQTDFLIRKYKWGLEDILFDPDGSLSLDVDPKQRWAERHPESFPVRVLSAGRDALLRVPGVGPITAGRILKTRRQGHITGLKDVGLVGKRLQKASKYVVME